jgi:hypothetical protein
LGEPGAERFSGAAILKSQYGDGSIALHAAVGSAVTRARARNPYTSGTSTFGSSPSVAEKRTFGASSVRTVQGPVRAA